jgi:hypothetical protein
MARYCHRPTGSLNTTMGDEPGHDNYKEVARLQVIIRG